MRDQSNQSPAPFPNKRREKAAKPVHPPSAPCLSIVTSTHLPAGPLAARLKVWFQLLGFPYEVLTRQYHSLPSYILDPDGGLLRQPQCTHVFLIRVEDWNHCATSPYDGVHPESRKLIEHNLAASLESFDFAANRLAQPVLIMLMPSHGTAHSSSLATFCLTIEDRLRTALHGMPNLRVVSDWNHPVIDPMDWTARQIARNLHAFHAERRRGVIVWFDAEVHKEEPHWREFLSALWASGRRVALAGCSTPSRAVLDQYAAAALDAAPLANKLERLKKELLAADHELTILATPSQAQTLRDLAPASTVLSILNSRLDFLDHYQHFWCFDALSEESGDNAPVDPIVPPLAHDLLLRLARAPYRTVDYFLTKGNQ